MTAKLLAYLKRNRQTYLIIMGLVFFVLIGQLALHLWTNRDACDADPFICEIRENYYKLRD
ncbi:hypothetical protein ACOTTU_21940 [Roseobacter sp. EG26]|uniref:hypothetical protein n=1 Tax=Roseobacter sp. EG26 TaxID=3412477 RepID=UPI003CE44B18